MRQSIGGSFLDKNEVGAAFTVVSFDDDPQSIEAVVDAVSGDVLYESGGTE